MNKIIKEAAILTAITLVAGICLGFVFEITKQPIEVQKEKAKTEAYQTVFADADTFESVLTGEDTQLQQYLADNDFTMQTIDEVVEAKDASGESLGYVLTVTDAEAYDGDVTFAMGVTLDGVMNGLSFLSITETAGLGMQADTDEFKDQFKGKQVEQFEYTKNGASSDEQIDALSGATVTTNAVTNGVNAGLLAAKYYIQGGNQ